MKLSLAIRFILIVILCFGFVACTGLETLAASAVAALIKYRELHETYAHDIKKRYLPTDAAYQEAQAKYLAARDSYESYIESLRLPTSSTQDSADLEELEKTVQNASAEFLSTATRSLDPHIVNTRGLVQKAAALPPEVLTALRGIPAKHRSTVVDAVKDQVTWRSWDDI